MTYSWADPSWGVYRQRGAALGMPIWVGQKGRGGGSCTSGRLGWGAALGTPRTHAPEVS